jgi:hypothetical protein
MDKDWRWDGRQLQIVDPRLRFDVNILAPKLLLHQICRRHGLACMQAPFVILPAINLHMHVCSTFGPSCSLIGSKQHAAGRSLRGFGYVSQLSFDYPRTCTT